MNISQPSTAIPRPAAGRPSATLLVKAINGLAAIVMIGAGIWSFADPPSFARYVQFSEHTHYLHDVGAFQIGIGVTLVLALIWADGLAVALGGFFTANTLHVTSHLIDLEIGGRPTDWLLLSILSLLALVALLARLRQLAAARPTIATGGSQ